MHRTDLFHNLGLTGAAKELKVYHIELFPYQRRDVTTFRLFASPVAKNQAFFFFAFFSPSLLAIVVFDRQQIKHEYQSICFHIQLGAALAVDLLMHLSFQV